MKHKTDICALSGEVMCSCEWFRFRLAPLRPTLQTPDLWCKHIERAVAALERKAERKGAYSCCHCCGVAVQGSRKDYFGLCDESGEPVPGLICRACVEFKKEHLCDELSDDETLAAAMEADGGAGTPASLELVEAAPCHLAVEHSPLFDCRDAANDSFHAMLNAAPEVADKWWEDVDFDEVFGENFGDSFLDDDSDLSPC